MGSIEYPSARRCSHVDTYQSLAHGNVQVTDPYRWLEDSESAETAQFVDEQNNAFQSYILSCPHREEMRQAIAEVTAVPQLGCPHAISDFYYYTHRKDTPQPIMYRKGKGVSGLNSDLGQVFMNANLFSEKGTSAVQACAFSENGRFFAYALSESGSDWLTIYIAPVESTDAMPTVQEPAFMNGFRLADKVEHVKWSTIHWGHDEMGLYYQQFPKTKTAEEPDQGSGIFYHALGTSQEADLLIHRDDDNPFKQYFPSVSDDGAWVVITETYHGALLNEVIIISTSGQVKRRARIGDDISTNPVYLGNVGTIFYFSTTWDASRGRVVAYDVTTESCIDHIAEDDTALLRAAYAYSENYLLIVYTEDVKDELWIFDLVDGRKLRQIGQDIVGSVQIKQTLGRRMDAELFLKFSSYQAPDSVYAVSNESIHLHSQSSIPGLDPSEYITRQEFYSSKDGTRVPMFLTHKNDPVEDVPILLYGYGGFNVSVTPTYNPAFVSFLRGFGGIVACVNLRGGGEYGEEWHRAGMLGKKQNVMDDMHAAAEYLVRQGYTTHDKIVAQGGSNGGLVVAACLNQRPELYGCVVAKVAVLDCLRYTTSAAGSLGISEIGDPQDPGAFDYLRAYSPLHNIIGDAAIRNLVVDGDTPRDVNETPSSSYPPALFMTADHDNRVPAMHSLKHVATLQHCEVQQKTKIPSPILLRVDKQAGHGLGKSLVKTIDELCDQWAFVAQSTGLRWRP